MKNERILNILGQVDEKYILEAAPGKQKKSGKVNWTKWGAWGAMAACACLVFFVGTRVVFYGGFAESASDTAAGETAMDNGYKYAESAKQEAAMDGAMMENAPAEAPEAMAPSSAASAAEPEETGSGASMKETEEKTEVNWGITLTVENVTPTGLTLICTQSGGEITGELQTGSYYKLRRAIGDISWEEVPYIVEAVAWTEEAYPIPMEGSTQWEINWEKIYGQLPAGRYRLDKDIMNVREPGDYDMETFIVEFVIEE